jgi:hypothetical protein
MKRQRYTERQPPGLMKSDTQHIGNCILDICCIDNQSINHKSVHRLVKTNYHQHGIPNSYPNISYRKSTLNRHSTFDTRHLMLPRVSCNLEL